MVTVSLHMLVEMLAESIGEADTYRNDGLINRGLALIRYENPL